MVKREAAMSIGNLQKKKNAENQLTTQKCD